MHVDAQARLAHAGMEADRLARARLHNLPPVELYNLKEDPQELVNLADKEPEVVKTLKARMEAFVERRMKETGKGDPIKEYWIGTDRRIGSVATAQKLQAQGAKK